METSDRVGNQLPILLISFPVDYDARWAGWESVTNPLDKLYAKRRGAVHALGISYQSS